jgi:hypothetical protein
MCDNASAFHGTMISVEEGPAPSQPSRAGGIISGWLSMAVRAIMETRIEPARAARGDGRPFEFRRTALRRHSAPDRRGLARHLANMRASRCP